MSANAAEPRGIRASAKRAVAHFKSISQLQKELAALELKQKAASLGAGAALGIAAGVMAFYAVAFGFATVAVALALVLDLWLALLIVFAVLVLLTLLFALLARRMMKKGTPLAPEQAIEEARLTKQVLRSGHGG